MVAPATSINDVINRVSKGTASEEDLKTFRKLCEAGIATTYQGKGAQNTMYEGIAMQMNVAIDFNRAVWRDKKSNKFDKLTITLSTSGNFEDVVPALSDNAATIPTVLDRLEQDQILERALEKQDDIIKILILHSREGYSHADIERKTNIDHRRMLEMEKKFIAEAKKIAES